MEVRRLLLGELHDARHGGIEGIIPADADILSWVDLGSALADNDFARLCMGSVRHFHAEALPVGITTQTCGTTRLFMCHMRSRSKNRFRGRV